MTPSKEALESDIKDLESTLATLQSQRKDTEAKLKFFPANLTDRVGIQVILQQPYNGTLDCCTTTMKFAILHSTLLGKLLRRNNVVQLMF